MTPQLVSAWYLTPALQRHYLRGHRAGIMGGGAAFTFATPAALASTSYRAESLCSCTRIHDLTQHTTDRVLPASESLSSDSEADSEADSSLDQYTRSGNSVSFTCITHITQASHTHRTNIAQTSHKHRINIAQT